MYNDLPRYIVMFPHWSVDIVNNEMINVSVCYPSKSAARPS